MDVGRTQPDNDQRQKSNMSRKTLQYAENGNGNTFGIGQGTFDIPTATNLFYGAPTPTDRLSTQNPNVCSPSSSDQI